MTRGARRVIEIPSGPARLEALLDLAPQAHAVVVVAHGTGSSVRAPQSGAVAATLRDAALGALFVDLLTPAEDAAYASRFDIGLLTTRLAAAVKWIEAQPETAGLPIGIFGAGTGTAAALQVAAALRSEVRAVVSRDGRPDLTSRKALALVKAPTLLIVGAEDRDALLLNRRTLPVLRCEKQLTLVAGAARLYDAPNALAEAVSLAARWFSRHLGGAGG